MLAFIAHFKAVLELIEVKKVSIFGGFLRDMISAIQENKKKIKIKDFLSEVDPAWTICPNDINFVYDPDELNVEKLENIFKCIRAFGYEITKYGDNTYIVSHDAWDFCFPIDFRFRQYPTLYDFDINGFELNLHDNRFRHINPFVEGGQMRYILNCWKTRETSIHDLHYLSLEDQKPRRLKMLKHGTFEQVDVRPLKEDEEKNACEVCSCNSVVRMEQYICKHCDRKCCQMCLTDPELCCPYCD